MTIHQSPTIHEENKNSDSIAKPLFELKNIGQAKNDQIILDEINLEIHPEKLTTIIGPSGAGKTSLLRLLNRLDDPTSGEIFYDNHPITDLPVQKLRREIGFVFQTPVIFPGTVADNLKKALEFGDSPIANQESVEFLIREMLTLAEIDPSLAERDAARLSVGQKQRVNIARALMTLPEVLLMDEPTSALDPETADRLMKTVRHRLVNEKKLTVVMITHRLSEARRISDTTIFMEAGRVIEMGATKNIFENSGNPRVRRFLANGK